MCFRQTFDTALSKQLRAGSSDASYTLHMTPDSDFMHRFFVDILSRLLLS